VASKNQGEKRWEIERSSARNDCAGRFMAKKYYSEKSDAKS